MLDMYISLWNIFIWSWSYI